MIRALTPAEMADLTTEPLEAGFGAVDTGRGNLPLRSLTVDTTMEGLTARTTVRQRFANVFDEPLEATYIFPLPPRAAVVGFRMTVGGKTIFARIDERAAARRDYDTAIAEGRHAAILEEERPDVFTIRVGNIPARSTVSIEFTLLIPIVVDSLEATFRFPLVVAPRYCPGNPLDGSPVGDGVVEDTDLVPDASRITPPVLLPGMASPVQLQIQARLGSGALVSRTVEDAVACSLPVAEELDGDGTRIITVTPGQRLDRDFILRWAIGDADAVTSTLTVEPDAAPPRDSLGSGLPAPDAAGSGTFSLTIVPPRDDSAARLPRDVVFVLDRSGSMGGWKMVSAKRAVARMIDSLDKTDRAAVVAFDSAIEYFTKGTEPLELREATDRNRWSMLEWLARIDARGGTELARGLAIGLEAAKAAGETAPARNQFLILVTDGQVGDDRAVLQSLHERLGTTRLFVVGIETAVNEGLLSQLADASGGLTEMVESEDRFDDVMERIQQRIATPLVSKLALVGQRFDIDPASITPARLPDLVPGLPVVIRGRYRGNAAGSAIVTGLTRQTKHWAESVPVAATVMPGLGTLWARAKLRQLEDDYAVGSFGDTASSLESRIVALSTSFGVLCRFTALVAIDKDAPDSPQHAAPPRRIVQPVDALVCLDQRAMPPLAMRSEEWLFSAHLDDSGLGVRACRKPPSGGEGSDDPLGKFRIAARRLLSRMRLFYDAGKPDAHGRVRWFVRRVLKLLVALGKAGVAANVIEPIAAPLGKLYALPDDKVALKQLFEALAAFASP